MRNMVQLLGGVAVAGAVAAGATAFTAPGVVATGVNTTGKVYAGGLSADVAITGAALSTLKVVTATGGGYTDIELTLATDDGAAAPIVSGTVKALVAGTSGTSAPLSPTYTDCTFGASKWTCTAGSSKQWDTITGLKISVVDPGI